MAPEQPSVRQTRKAASPPPRDNVMYATSLPIPTSGASHAIDGRVWARIDRAGIGGTARFKGSLVLHGPDAQPMMVVIVEQQALPDNRELRLRFALTPRESEVARLMADRLSNIEIALGTGSQPTTRHGGPQRASAGQARGVHSRNEVRAALTRSEHAPALRFTARSVRRRPPNGGSSLRSGRGRGPTAALRTRASAHWPLSALVELDPTGRVLRFQGHDPASYHQSPQFSCWARTSSRCWDAPSIRDASPSGTARWRGTRAPRVSLTRIRSWSTDRCVAYRWSSASYPGSGAVACPYGRAAPESSSGWPEKPDAVRRVARGRSLRQPACRCRPQAAGRGGLAPGRRVRKLRPVKGATGYSGDVR